MIRPGPWFSWLAHGLTRGYWKCPECGTVNDANASHCAGCGRS